MSDLNNYLNSNLQEHPSKTINHVIRNLSNRENKVFNNVLSGDIEIEVHHHDHDNGSSTLKDNNETNEEKDRKNTKREKKSTLIKVKKQSKKSFSNNNEKIKEIEEQIKKWTEDSNKIRENKSIVLKKQEEKISEERKQKELKEQEEKETEKEEKRKRIENNLQNIKENKLHRERSLTYKNISSVNLESKPLFLEIEENFKTNQSKELEQQKNIFKNKKVEMLVNYESLKNHERNFIIQIEERNKKFEEKRLKASSLSEIDFVKYTNRSEEKVREDHEKNERRWKFQEKIKQIPVKIDFLKRDELKYQNEDIHNRFEHNYFSHKNLNGVQTDRNPYAYESKDPHKEIGKKYLIELKSNNSNPSHQESKITRTNSLKLSVNKHVQDERPQYKNYLTELKLKRNKSTQNPNEDKLDIQRMLQYKNKNEIIKKLEIEADLYDQDVLAKIKELKKFTSKDMLTTIKKEEEIDKIYSKAIKTKLALLEIS